MEDDYSAREIIEMENSVLTGGRTRYEGLGSVIRIICVMLVVGFVFGWLAHGAFATHLGRTSTASWYGPGFYGKRTACGSTVQRNSMIVANKYLPCWTHVLVCWNRRCAHAVVADRGPYITGRELDLGPGTARALHFSGVHRVRWWIGR